MTRSLAISVILLVAAFVLTAAAQDPEQAAKKKQKAMSGELYETIAALDAQVFAAFNAHDLERLMAMFTEDLEFYDDGGNGGAKTYAQVKEDFAKVFKNVPDLRRELVPGTVEVYPLKGYGAIQVGEHRFCHEENGKQDCGVTKFSMVWRKSGETWKLARILSYAH
jgi:ketosteroid isomerase-like protein